MKLNKIYRKIIEIIRDNTLIICLYFVLIFSIIYPVDYYIITGGGTMDAKDRIEINTKNKIKGSLKVCYVSQLKGTLFSYVISYIIPTFDRESTGDYKINGSETVEDIEFRNKMLLKQTNNDAIYNAYKKAGMSILEEKKHIYIYFLDEKSDTDLKVGDELISADGITINEVDDLKEIVGNKIVNDKVSVVVKRNGKKKVCYCKVYKYKNHKYIGVSIMIDYNYKTKPEIKFKFKDSESGPSGGLIETLQIYNQLVKEDITKGLIIAGTGTIERDGTVGSIGGVKYKLNGAVKSKADLFLVPSGENYKEAIKEKKKRHYKIKIIGVKSFDDALKKIKKA